MTSSLALASSNASHDIARTQAARASASILRHLARFAPRHRAAVAAMAARNSRLADLAVSFPALLFALSVPRFGKDVTPLITAVIKGAPLKELARAAGLPMWSRRLMPEAFDGTLGSLPDGDFVARQICNHLPRSPKTAAKWLHAVSAMHRWSTPDMAVWIAREVIRDPKGVDLRRIPLIALYGFFSSRLDTKAGSLIKTPWQPAMQWESALEQAAAWMKRAALLLYLGTNGIIDCWHDLTRHDGIEFVPLRTATDFVDEANGMQNCVDTYGAEVGRHRCRLWSLRQNGVRIATMAIASSYNDPVAQISQICGPNNKAVAPEIALAAHQWLRSQPLRMAPAKGESRPVIAWTSPHLWLELWKPYWIARRSVPDWLPRYQAPSMLHLL